VRGNSIEPTVSNGMTESMDIHAPCARGAQPAQRARRLLANRRGAVFVEFLIAFLPVQIFFLCLIQSAILYSVRLVTEHAAVNGARAAAVVFGDDRARYNGELEHNVSEDGERRKAVRRAVIITLAPMILNGLIQSVEVLYPRGDQLDGAMQTGPLKYDAMSEQTVNKVRVRVEVQAACRIGFASQIMCPSLAAELTGILVPTRSVRAEAIFPYQGAKYDY
jgi:hypothetical protein